METNASSLIRRSTAVESLPASCGVHESAHPLLRSVWDEASLELARVVRAMGIAPGRAEDVLQEVYLTAWRKAPQEIDATDLRRWLYRVAVNQCRLEHRRHGRWQSVWRRLTLAWSGTDRHSDAERGAEQGEQRRMVRQALGRLEPAMRGLLVLRYFAEFDSREIGRILEVPDATVRSRLRTARKQLALELERAGYRYEE